MTSGYTFTMQDHFRDSFNQKYLVEEVTHKGSQTGYLVSGLSSELPERERQVYYQNEFKAIPVAVQYRPERKTTKPRISGTLHAKIDDSSLTDCSFAHADLSGINAQHADFSKSDFSFARMKEINLFKGSLRKAKLEQTDFTGANLYGVDFFKAGIRDANFEKANLDDTLLVQGRPA
jgi:hypothetical protein